MKRIQVLMSTYNGEKYIRNQINSIQNQKGVEVNLLIRDDGSKDSTISILEQYNDIRIVKGDNIGATNSFFELINLSGEYDYYAFADQDDVWDNDKLLAGVKKLETCNCPAIYSSNTRLVDRDLNYIRDETKRPITNLGSAIVKNYATGCTLVFNSQLMKRLKGNQPKHAPFHDWWVNLVCLSIGGVSIFDEKPHMSYRQHDNNVVSGNSSFFKKWKYRFNSFFTTRFHRDLTVKEIVQLYGSEISDYNKNILLDCTSMHCLFTGKYKTGNRIDDLLFIVLLLLKRY